MRNKRTKKKKTVLARYNTKSVQQWHPGDNQQLPNWTYDKLIKREFIPSSANLTNYPQLERS